MAPMALQAHQEAGLRRPPARHQDLIPVRREVHIRPAVLPVQHIPAAAARQATVIPEVLIPAAAARPAEAILVAAIPAVEAHLAAATAAAVIPVADVVAVAATVVATVPAAVVEGDSSLRSFCQMIVKQLDHS